MTGSSRPVTRYTDYRVYRHNEEVTILQIGESELDFNHSVGRLSIWWQSGQKNARL